MKGVKNLMTSGLFAYAIIFASKASAQTTTGQGPTQGWGYSNAPANVPTDLEKTIMNVTNFILGFIAIIATLIVIYGGVLYLTAAGNDDQIGRAKKTISAGIIGIVIAGLAYALVTIVINVILA